MDGERQRTVEGRGGGLGTALSSRRWQRLIPVAFITHSFAYPYRSNYSLGTAGGLKGSLGITPGIDALLGALFFLGYFFFQRYPPPTTRSTGASRG